MSRVQPFACKCDINITLRALANGSIHVYDQSIRRLRPMTRRLPPMTRRLPTVTRRSPSHDRKGVVQTSFRNLLIWRPQGDSNPRYRRERAVSSAGVDDGAFLEDS